MDNSLEFLANQPKDHSSEKECALPPSDDLEDVAPQAEAAVQLGLSKPTLRKQPRRKARILAVEYTLLGGVNDSPADAERLAEWLRGVACVVNLITFNSHHGTPFSMSSLERSKAFRQVLLARGQLCTFRDSRGDDEMAACG